MPQDSDDFDAFESGPSRTSHAVRGVLALLVLASTGAAVVAGARYYLKGADAPPPRAQQVAVLRQTPPPPPKPPEKPPEPPKVKEEVKLDTPTPEPKPADPKPAEAPPAADRPLGVDADAGAGSDGFGLAANRGGRDLVGSGTGGGGGGAYYSGLLQRYFHEALTRNRKLLGEEFRVVVRIWIGDDGRVQRAEIVNGSGKVELDGLIQSTLAEMSPLRDVPPPPYRQMQLRLSNRA